MPIYDGLDEISQIYDGTTELEAVYDGTDEVWSNNKVFYLGYGTSFDAKNVYDKWQELNINNFYMFRQGSHMDQSSWAAKMGTNYCTWHYGRSYSNGVYSFALGGSTPQYNPSYTNNYAVLVTKPEKLKYLGTGFANVKELYPTKYQNFTLDNFLLQYTGSGGGAISVGDEDDYFHTFGGTNVSYNNETGIINANAVINGHAGNDHRSGGFSFNIYLYTGRIRNL